MILVKGARSSINKLLVKDDISQRCKLFIRTTYCVYKTCIQYVFFNKLLEPTGSVLKTTKRQNYASCFIFKYNNKQMKQNYEIELFPSRCIQQNHQNA